MSRWDYFMTEMRVITTYIRLIFLPINQNLDYDYPIYRSFITPPVLLSFLFLVFLLGVAVYLLIKVRKAETNSKKLEVNSEKSEDKRQNIGTDERQKGDYSRLFAFGILWFFITLSVESSIIPIDDVIFEHRVYLPSVGFFTAITAVVFFVAKSLRKEKEYLFRYLC